LLAEQLGDPGELELVVLQPVGDLLLVAFALDGPWRCAGWGRGLAEPRKGDDLLIGRSRTVCRNPQPLGFAEVLPDPVPREAHAARDNPGAVTRLPAPQNLNHLDQPNLPIHRHLRGGDGQ
jgi:hypothetical protein